ncbi:MAG: hypothetical protein HRT61_21690 [Ekhidna sp.]|nr:hypothetical protein [Ekhidna sp.]
MKRILSKNQNSLRALAIVLGLFVCGIVLGQGLTQNESQVVSENSSVHTLKQKVQSNKNIIINTYLLGVSLYKEAID